MLRKSSHSPIVLSPNELQVWLRNHEQEIIEHALAQPLFAARHDDIGYGLDLLAGYLNRNRIAYNKSDPDCQHYIRVAELKLTESLLPVL